MCHSTSYVFIVDACDFRHSAIRDAVKKKPDQDLPRHASLNSCFLRSMSIRSGRGTFFILGCNRILHNSRILISSHKYPESFEFGCDTEQMLFNGFDIAANRL